MLYMCFLKTKCLNAITVWQHWKFIQTWSWIPVNPAYKYVHTCRPIFTERSSNCTLRTPTHCRWQKSTLSKTGVNSYIVNIYSLINFDDAQISWIFLILILYLMHFMMNYNIDLISIYLTVYWFISLFYQSFYLLMLMCINYNVEFEKLLKLQSCGLEKVAIIILIECQIALNIINVIHVLKKMQQGSLYLIWLTVTKNLT